MYLKASMIRALAKEKGKRIGKDFLDRLNRHVEAKIQEALAQHNGGRKTLDGVIADFVIGSERGKRGE